MKYLIKKNIQKNILLFLILFLIMFMFFIIYYNIFFKEKEGFNINDIDNMFNDVKNITTVVGKVPQQITNIDNKLIEQVKVVEKNAENMIASQVRIAENKAEIIGGRIENRLNEQVTRLERTIDDKTTQIGQIIQQNVLVIFKEKIGNIFIQLGNIFKDGIVDPILEVFNGIGNIFTKVFNILKEIANKIISLPNCIFTYAIASTIDTIYFFYERITPKFLKNIFSSIYYYTFRYVFDFIGYITGYNDSYNRCYEFNVSSEVDKIQSNLVNIQSSFTKDFGRLNFSQIKF